MSPMTNALISYWHRLPAESPLVRRKALDALHERIRAGMESRAALVPCALADVDDGIVAAATQAYVAAGVSAAQADIRDPAAAIEATEWIRRGLALNRGAVFGALLALGDERLVARLAALRLLLAPAEIESACHVIGPAPGPRAVEFLQEWRALVAEGPLAQERMLLDAALAPARQAQAA